MTLDSIGRILLVDDDRQSRDAMEEWLEDDGFDVIAVEDGKQALAHLHDGISVIVTDLKMPRTNGLELLKLTKQKSPHATVILITGHGTAESAVEALKEGAFDYLIKPVKPQELVHRIRMALEKQSMAKEIAQLHRQLNAGNGLANMIGQCPAMRQIFEKIQLVADTNSTVLIIGESGTGKELVARAVHANSTRRKNPFLPVNCAAIPETLIESELFGHEKGAFTGASTKREGLFQAAQGGTLFVDEIGEMQLGLQSKLLRAIENKKVMLVGSTREIDVDVRLVAATNRDLAKCVEQGNFREDLYYRLKVIELRLPPLRERREDIPLLVRYFIDQLAKENNRSVKDISNEAFEALKAYDWPGNVRELRNTLESIIVLCLRHEIELSDLPPHISGAKTVQAVIQPGMTMADIEKEAIRRALEQFDSHRAQTANCLGISVRTLHRKIKDYGLEA
ncbi:sigma-54-dependent transcriptional regulator [Bythopirellula polymerisocia]|uniref:Transcriptional regulatory protein ZraR n=1 Tax=Bythopirellula polymerisocia TaxID=2528003 RepID=A0A5C6CYA8_9BACT|nr:sigma-54 dependent transcriptional regulator [Bythopirellula polymerisocia]TWU27629.1 Transcriptional regulatory protein ZraR [Bythopirellula polymerisocia]